MTVSAHGSHSGTGVLWATLPRAGDANQMTVPGDLYAFDAENLTLLWSSFAPGDDPLNFAKGSPPIVANGKVYVASISNFVSVYGPRKHEPKAQNLALHAHATGSPPCDRSQSPDKAFNNSAERGPTDKWCSSSPNPFVQADLGRNLTVSRFVLEQLGMPFKKPEEPRPARVVAPDNRPKAEPKAEPTAEAAAPAAAGDKK